MQDDSDLRPSRTRLKQEAEERQAFGERLVSLPEAVLASLPLPPKLLDAVRTARELTQRGALRRQRQYIGRLMRELDTDELEEAVAALERQRISENAAFHEAEAWRDRLVNGDAKELESFFDAFPQADRQRVRHLVRGARAEAAAGRPPRLRRELFREIRNLDAPPE